MEIILDLDVTDDVVGGHEEQIFFNFYNGEYCYALLYIFCGKGLLVLKLRPSVDLSLIFLCLMLLTENLGFTTNKKIVTILAL
jgi:hypothetical protein